MKQQLTPILLPTKGIESISKGSSSLSAGIKQYSFNGIVKCIEEYFASGKKQPLFNTLSLCGIPDKEANGYCEHMWQPQHLHLVSDEEIKEGDWFYTPKEVGIEGISQLTKGYTCFAECKKIIATTDKSLTINIKEPSINDWVLGKFLTIPQIPESFVKHFVEKQGNVGKVMVEYEEIGRYQITKWFGTGKFQPKLTKNNEVIISLEEKSYSREEVLLILSNYRLDNAGENLGKHNKWIEQNL